MSRAMDRLKIKAAQEIDQVIEGLPGIETAAGREMRNWLITAWCAGYSQALMDSAPAPHQAYFR